MNLRSQFNRSALVALASIAAAACSPSPDNSGGTFIRKDTKRVPSQPSVTEKGIGTLVIGMSVADAERALGTAFIPAVRGDAQQCRMARWEGAPPGVSAMVEKGTVVRIDVDSGSVSTADAVYLGELEAGVAEAYPGRIETMPHKYVAGGHYLTVLPAVPADSSYRLIFETDGVRVTRFRGGLRPQVEYVERCG